MDYSQVSVDGDRWIAVSTSATWDKQKELFTEQAIDWDREMAEKTGNYPELRLWHVRGFKLGNCDSMSRLGKYAVDSGYWNNTPFAQAVKDMIMKNDGKWKVSRGFYSVEAAGSCPRCGTSLTVHPINHILGVVCSGCKHYTQVDALKKLQYLKTLTFDISITDVPANSVTGVTAYSVQ